MKKNDLFDRIESFLYYLIKKTEYENQENLNEDKDGAFLVDGVVEDLITEFSMIKEIEVASRKTCFTRTF